MSNPSPRNPVQTPPRTVPRPGSAPRRQWFGWAVLVAIVLSILAYVLFFRPPAPPAQAGRGFGDKRPMPVAAEPAREASLIVRSVALGTVTPVNAVTIRSRVDGELRQLFFTEGSTVEAGAPLAEIDPRPFEVQKLQSEAQLARDRALLDNARMDLERFQVLLGQDSVAKQEVDTQAALVRQYEAALKVDQAQVESASLQLAYAHVTSPIAGRIGLRTVDVGNIVHASDANGIAVVIQLHPITVLFSIPQDAVPKVMKRFGSGEALVVEAYDRDGRTLLATGRLVTVDNQIDPTTGTVKLRAEFANADDTLFPNQFVNVQLLVEKLEGVIVVPTAAVQRGISGTFVYVVSEQSTVVVRPIETGPSEKGQIVIARGLAAGEVVVIDGVDKLREGSAVEVVKRDTAMPTANPDKKRDRSGQALNSLVSPS